MGLNQFAYDGQTRRFLLQFMRIMSRFQVEFGKDRNGNTLLQQVPVVYGDPSRQAAQIMSGNSENSLPSVPCMSCYISALEYDRSRVQEPFHISKMQIRERNYDHTSDSWGHSFGDSFTVERMMPVPYKMSLKLDIWTSNTTQKFQILEQLYPLFNPSIEIQSTDNYIDWTSLSAILLTGTNFTSRTVPAGGDSSIDVSTMTFELPIWYSLPAKIKELGVIQKIIQNIYDDNGDLLGDLTDLPVLASMKRMVSQTRYGVVYYNGELRLFYPHNVVNASQSTVDLEVGDTYAWSTLISMYGLSLTNGVSQVRLEQPNGSTVVGTVAYHPTDPKVLLFSPFSDTIPSNTLPPVTAVIDPFNVPVDTSFVNAAVGTRYLILNDIGSAENVYAAEAWHGKDGSDLIAKANDIIEFDGIRWFVSFAADGQPAVRYCTNLKTGIQFKWMPDEGQWSKSIDGEYLPEQWSIVI